MMGANIAPLQPIAKNRGLEEMPTKFYCDSVGYTLFIGFAGGLRKFCCNAVELRRASRI
jgi:hypothetical protein